MARKRDDDYDDYDDEDIDERPRRRRRRDDDDYDDRPKRDIPNYLVHAILATLFCCLPLGIVAIIKASSVNNFVAEGNYRAAEKASAEAKKFVNLSVILGLVVGVIYFVLNIFVFAAAGR